MSPAAQASSTQITLKPSSASTLTVGATHCETQGKLTSSF